MLTVGEIRMMPMEIAYQTEPTKRYTRKRDGITLQPFETTKLYNAVVAAWKATHNGEVDERAIHKVIDTVLSSIHGDDVIDVELVQDAVETSLMRHKHFAVAKAYILYRNKRTELRILRERAVDPKGISDYIHASKYARYIPELQRREVFEETVARVEGMHISQFPAMEDEIREAFDFVREKRLLPSMRSMQFGGAAILKNHNRLYNCVGVETQFITQDGVCSFAEFKDGEETVVLTHTGNWKRARVRSYGQQQLFEYQISRGRSSYTVRATRDHTWILGDGSRTRDLSLKHKLVKPPRLVGAWEYEDAPPNQRLYWAMGYVYGDGTLVKDRDGEYRYSMVRLCGDDGRFLERFQELGYSWSAPPSYNGESIVYTGKYLKTVPSIKGDGFENVVAFVRGFLDAGGHKNPNNDKYRDRNASPSHFNGIQVSGGEAIDFVRRVFPAVGAYITREEDRTGQETNYGVRPETSYFGLVLGFGDSPASPFSVQSITEGPVETVWCLEVEDDHSFVMPNGIVTGNCSFTPIDRLDAFSEALFLLLSGCGVGYSVQFDHVEKLPHIGYIDSKKVAHHVVEDTIEGWADALKALMWSYQRGVNLEISYHLIRPAGTPLKTSGGVAPGHLKLKESLERVRGVLSGAQGRKLRPIECHRILCHAADAVLSGGIRRSAMISLFSLDDSEMMYSKTGNWYDSDPWFANANNSVILKRDEVTQKQFKRIFQMTRQWGEPGFYFTNDYNYGTNPCAEISFDPRLKITEELSKELFTQGIEAKVGETYSGWAFCNLCEINAAKLTTYEDFEAVAKAATLIGTLQATYTKMPYLGWVSEQLAKRDALLGIGMTGILDAPHIACKPEFQQSIARKVKDWNIEYATRLGIRPAARTTCVKPSGCRPWDSLTTTDQGILTMEELFESHPTGDVWAKQPDGLHAILQDGQRAPITRTFDNDEAEVVEIEMNFGLVVRSTTNHPWFVKEIHVRDNDNNKHVPLNEWVRAGQIQPGHVLDVNTTVYRNETPWKFVPVNHRALTMRAGTQIIKQPEVMDEDIAWLVGYLWGDGAFSVSKYRLRFVDGHREIIAKAQRIFEEKFGLICNVRELEDRDAATLEVASKHLYLWCVRNGLEKYAEGDTLDFIPRCIRSSSWKHLCAFAAGLVDSDGCVSATKSGSRFQISSASDDFSRHFQHVMWAVGLGFGRSLVDKGKSFQEQRHLWYMNLASGPSNEDAVKCLISNSVKCQAHQTSERFERWQIENDTTQGRQIPGKVREIRKLGVMPTYDIEVQGAHWFYDGAVKSHNTTSLELGCVGSGHHAHHARRYIRRVTADELEPVFQAFRAINPHMCVRKPDGKWVIEFPVEAPPTAVIKDDIRALEFLGMVKSTQQNWVLPGTSDLSAAMGLNHNVSNTVTIRPDEWEVVANYLWENRDFFTGVSLLPSSGDKDYAFAPNEAIVTDADEMRWNEILRSYKAVDYTTLIESEDGTNLSGEVACAGGVCSIF